jgi:hypothetical protein
MKHSENCIVQYTRKENEFKLMFTIQSYVNVSEFDVLFTVSSLWFNYLHCICTVIKFIKCCN